MGTAPGRQPAARRLSRPSPGGRPAVRTRSSALLERPFAEMDEEDRQRCLARIRPELSRLDEFLQHAVATVNEIRHDLRYLVTLHHGPLELELRRRIPADQDHLLSAAEVEAGNVRTGPTCRPASNACSNSPTASTCSSSATSVSPNSSRSNPDACARQFAPRARARGTHGLRRAAGKQSALRPLPQALSGAPADATLDRPARPDQQRQDAPLHRGDGRRRARHLPLAATSEWHWRIRSASNRWACPVRWSPARRKSFAKAPRTSAAPWRSLPASGTSTGTWWWSTRCR